MKNYIIKSGIIILLLFFLFTFYHVVLFKKIELEVDENKIVMISDQTVAFPLYVDGTQCIVTESSNHGAITCNWNKRH